MKLLARNFIAYILIFGSGITIFSSCITTTAKYDIIAPGKWRGVLFLEGYNRGLGTKKLPAKEQENSTGAELPFNFEVVYDATDKIHLEFINGEERIKVENIKIGRDKATAHDTIEIYFPEYGNYLHAVFNVGIMDGEWIIPSKNNYRIPFQAKHGQDYRFTNLKKTPKMDISGKWETIFVDETDSTKAIGEFLQNNNKLTGTFLTESGDYRYLDGTVQDNKIYLSCFDGAHAFLFEGKIEEDQSLQGVFYSGKSYKATWTAHKSNQNTLSDPFSLTQFTNNPITNTFINTENQSFTLNDGKYKGKNKIILISGTWCPNCKDASKFLVNYQKDHPNHNFEIIGTYFERGEDKDKIIKHLQEYKTVMNVPYSMCYVGKANKDEISKVFPSVLNPSAFPTILFINKENKIQKIYTGFYGPATSEYEKFKKDFDTQLQNMK